MRDDDRDEDKIAELQRKVVEGKERQKAETEYFIFQDRQRQAEDRQRKAEKWKGMSEESAAQSRKRKRTNSCPASGKQPGTRHSLNFRRHGCGVNPRTCSHRMDTHCSAILRRTLEV